MSGTGGMYAALLGKKNSKASASGASQNKAGPSTKSAKVMSLKDMKADKKPVAAKKEEVKEEKKVVVKEEQRDLTRREQKDAQKSSDRHVSRSGHGDFKQKDRDAVKDEVAGASDAVNAERDARRKEREEEDETRRKKAEEEAKMRTFAEFEKARAESKAAGIEGVKQLKERKVDVGAFKKMEKKTAAAEDSSLVFGKVAAKDDKKKVAAKAAPAPAASKKNKFKKADDLQLGFTSKPQQAPRDERPRGPKREERPRPAKKAETEAPAAAAAAAPVAEE